MKTITEETVKDVLSITGENGDKLLLFGRTGRYCCPRSEFEYSYEVRHVATEFSGERIYIREPGAVKIEFEELPEVSQLIVRKYWNNEDVVIPPHSEQ